MHDLLVALILFGLAGLACVTAAMAYARWRLRKQLRVRPGTRSTAPTAWLVSTSEPARLHRRLRRTTAVARAAGVRGGPTIATMAAEIEDHAVAIEAHLVGLSSVWRRDRTSRKQISGQVMELERLAARLSTSAMTVVQTRAIGAGSPDALAELNERIEALDAARTELAALEHHWHAS